MSQMRESRIMSSLPEDMVTVAMDLPSELCKYSIEA